MKKYIGKRIISFLIVLVGVSILSFLLIAWSGKDPAEIIAHRGVSNPTPEQIEMIRVEMGLDQPLPVRYIQWLSGMFTGELGTSLTTHQPIVKDLHKYLAISSAPVIRWNASSVTNSGDARSARVILQQPTAMAFAAWYTLYSSGSIPPRRTIWKSKPSFPHFQTILRQRLSYAVRRKRAALFRSDKRQQRSRQCVHLRRWASDRKN